MSTETHMLILTRIKEQEPQGWLVADGNVPIGIVTQTGEIHTPSGAGYRVHADGARVLLDTAEGAPVAEYVLDPEPRVRDAATGTVWELCPDWVTVAAHGDADGGHLDVLSAFARPYTLEDAQGTIPARVKLLMAYVVVQTWEREMTEPSGVRS